MARVDNLSNFLQDVAGAIKAKREITGKIKPEDFDTEILNIETSSTPEYVIHTITLDSDGGNELAPIKVVDGFSAKLPIPVRGNDPFMFWTHNGVKFDESTPITSDIVLMAEWDAQNVNYLVMYDNGDQCVDNSGGWKSLNTSGTCSFNNDSIYSNSSYSSQVNFTHINPIDLSEYCYVRFKAKINAAYDSKSYTRYYKLYLFKSADSNTNSVNAYTIANPGTNSYSGTVEKVVSLKTIDVTEHHHVGVHTVGSRDSSNYAIKGNWYYCALGKEDNIKSLYSLVGVNVETLDDAVTTSNLVRLLQNDDAVEYMLKKCTGSFMLRTTLVSEFYSLLVNNNREAQFRANEHWNKFLPAVVEPTE